jgi:hypothetical protein
LFAEALAGGVGKDFLFELEAKMWSISDMGLKKKMKKM